MRRRIPLAMVAAAALTAACGGGNGGDAATGGADGAATDAVEDGELTPITVGVLPIVDTAAIWLGVDQGIFEEHGLDVTLEVAQGGAAIAPAVVSGDYQFGFSNLVSLFVAGDQGLPLQLLAPGNASTGDAAADIGGIVALPDSGITGPADLAGKTVAVNTLANIGEVTVKNVVEQAGGDPDSVQFTELGFPDMPAAVAGGQVDAAWILEPFLTVTKNQGAQLISSNFAETDPDLIIAGYFTTAQNAQQEPELTEAFTAAMTESLEYAEANPDEARAILSTYTEIPAEVQEAMVMPRFPSEFDTDAVQVLADLTLKYGLVENEIDVEALLP
ncbi:ABC transporter substrate-binding protein [Georgenia sp. AZ-5]|uniref:ABC transporter substrate-binding protein n=1 Tax=Georgenia sp. AZ-5 TaxID=3367526 RepID=UPI003754E689